MLERGAGGSVWVKGGLQGGFHGAEIFWELVGAVRAWIWGGWAILM